MLLFADIDDDFVCNCNEGIKTQLLEKKYSLVVENVPHTTPDIELSDIDDSIPPVKEYVLLS